MKRLHHEDTQVTSNGALNFYALVDSLNSNDSCLYMCN